MVISAKRLSHLVTQQRIAELQASYRLFPGKGPVFYACDNNPTNELVATFFPTDPPTLLAERGDSTSLMYQQPARQRHPLPGAQRDVLGAPGGGEGDPWGYGANEMTCKPKR